MMNAITTNKHKNKTTLIALSALTITLVGCGSGSSAGSSGPTNKPRPGKPTVQFNAIKYQVAPDKQSVATSGVTSFSYHQGGTFNDKYEINIEGHKISIKDNYYNADRGFVVSGNRFLNGLSPDLDFYQLSKDKDVNGMYEFLVGKTAYSIPSTGQFTYTGYYEFSPIDTTESAQSTTGRLSFLVDFGKKKVSGTLDDVDFSGVKSDVKFEGDVKYSAFDGVAKINAAAKNKGYKDGIMNGAFFAEHAKSAGAIMRQKDAGLSKKTWSAKFFGKRNGITGP